MKEIQIPGKIGFAGITMGKISFIRGEKISSYSDYQISHPEMQIEIARKAFEKAQMEIDNRINVVRDNSKNRSDSEEALAVFTAHKEILKDKEFFHSIAEKIKNLNIEAGEAIREVTENYITLLRQSSVRTFQEKAWDMADIQNLLLLFCERNYENNRANFPELLWTDKITAHQVFEVKHHSVHSLVMESSSSSSHEMIIAKALQIPCLYEIQYPGSASVENAPAILDAREGVLIIYPEQKTLDTYNRVRSDFYIGNFSLEDTKKIRLQFENLPERYALGEEKLDMNMNLDFIEELTHFPKNKLLEVGLCRTEFLFHNETKVTEKNQEFIYSGIVQYMQSKPVTFRLFDINREKSISAVNANDLHGLESIRYLLKEKSLLQSQLQALVFASAKGPVKILLPMVCLVEEVEEVKTMVEEICAKSKSPIPLLGVMIETPAAIDIMPRLNPLVDFYSVGTNDLVQFLTATSRNNASHRHIYSVFHESHLASLERILENAGNLPVSICGEAAARIPSFLLLTALGFRKFSVSPINLPAIGAAIRRFDFDFARDLAKNLRKISSPAAREEFALEYTKKK